jgi:hypothetical protein
MPFVACDIRFGAASAVLTRSPLANQTRSVLGLPADVPLVVTGHEPSVPHAGIVAKYLAARSLTKRSGGQVVNLVIDTGLGRVGQFDVPLGELPTPMRATTVSMLEEHAGVLSRRPPAQVRAVERLDVGPPVQAGIESIRRAWASATGQTAGEQATSMVTGLLRDRVGAMASVPASRLLDTPLGEHMLDAIRHDPRSCVEAYNAAARAFPGVCKVLDTTGPLELPLWVVDGQTRRAATVEDLATPHRLQPRALVNTAIVRGSVADLFIHGTGGWAYDEVMERWMRHWLQWPLSPRIMVSATVRLPGCDDASIKAAIARAREAIRRKRHNPDGGDIPSRTKAEWLALIANLPRGSAAKREAFARMHQVFQAASADGSDDALAKAIASGRVASRRDWPFVLCGGEDLDQMTAAIEAELSEVAVPRPAIAG